MVRFTLFAVYALLIAALLPVTNARLTTAVRFPLDLRSFKGETNPFALCVAQVVSPWRKGRKEEKGVFGHWFLGVPLSWT
jgi:hypothetical protein